MNFDIILRGWIEAAWFFFFASFLWIEERKTEFLHKSSRSHTNREQVATAIMLILFQCKISFQCNDWTVNMNTHTASTRRLWKEISFSVNGMCFVVHANSNSKSSRLNGANAILLRIFFYCISRYLWRKSDVFFSIYLRFIRIMIASFFSTPFAFAIFFYFLFKWFGLIQF